ncbi:MAG: hypothetical protein WKF96_17715 [Solirubrobacteraceae bacterium]
MSTADSTSDGSRDQGLFGWLKDRAFPILLTALGAGLGSAAGLDELPIGLRPGHLLLAGFVLFVVGTFLLERGRGTRLGLKLERDELSARNLDLHRVARDLTQAYLESLSRRQAWWSSERVSLFLHRTDQFELVGRHCAAPSLRAIARTHFSESKGCLGAVWNGTPDGGSTVHRLPNATIDKTGWTEAQHDYGFSDVESIEMRMRSCVYVGLRIEDHAGREPLGVVLVESERSSISDADPQGFDGEKALAALRDELPLLKGLLSALR